MRPLSLLQLYFSVKNPTICNRNCVYCNAGNFIDSGFSEFYDIPSFIEFYKNNHQNYDMTDITIYSCDGGLRSKDVLFEIMKAVKHTPSYTNLTTNFRYLSTPEGLDELVFQRLSDEVFILSVDGDYNTMQRNRHTSKKEWEKIQQVKDWCKKYNVELLASSTLYPNRDVYSDLVFLQQFLNNNFLKWRWQFAFGDGIWSYEAVDRIIEMMYQFIIKKYLPTKKCIYPDLVVKDFKLRGGRYKCSSCNVIGNKNDKFGTCLKLYSSGKEYQPYIYKMINEKINACSQCQYNRFCVLCPYDLISMCYTSKEMYCYITKQLYELNLEINCYNGFRDVR